MTIRIMQADLNSDIRAFVAEIGDAEAVQGLMLATARWLHSKGSTQWGGLLKGHDDHNVPAAIDRGEVILFRNREDGKLAGMVLLQQQPSAWDRELWELGPEAAEDYNNPDHQGDPGTSIYLHRLMVNRSYAGTGLGRSILAWVETGAAYDGKDRIRLDCIAHNESLNLFYPSCGYTYVGGNGMFNTYEKMLPSS
ncbi:GNAT family N-acetyltransferase [Paenibacillus tuaregi]|uniref:GNAT family N-acetyltransferase n=1 Tax=Paenibacillus tuaregi TaxID=1816681 RepID=UPI000838C465|nr:GNAT family N-acetyltransferase [Paenibacillus tuaregi]